MVNWMLFLVLKIFLEVYDGNQLINPKIEKYFTPFNLEKNVLNFWHGPSEFPGDFVQCMIVYD